MLGTFLFTIFVTFVPLYFSIMMLDFSKATIKKLVVHVVGNKAKQENLTLSTTTVSLHDELLYDVITRYFLRSFKTDQLFYISDEGAASYQTATRMFEESSEFFNISKELAEYLYECGNHPRIKSGEFYVAYINDCIVNDEMVDAIGLFKSENKDTFLKVYPKKEEQIQVDEGVNINKLDKGCIIFNTEAESGYRACLVDNNSKFNEAHYWRTDFLSMMPTDSSYTNTVSCMELVKSFSEDCLSAENEIPREERLHFLQNAQQFFNDNEVFDLEKFQQEVIIDPEVGRDFSEYKNAFEEENALPQLDNFSISNRAVEKNNTKFFRSVIKLDKNFHVYVHGNANFIEQGFDVDRNLNFYKLYYSEES